MSAPVADPPVLDTTAGPPPGWRGPLIPVNTPSGDGRLAVLVGDEVPHRPLPLPLSAQHALDDAHNGSVVIGLITRMWVQDGVVWGEGPFDLTDPTAADWALRMARGVAGWVSVDMSDVAVTEVPLDADGNDASAALDAWLRAEPAPGEAMPPDPVVSWQYRFDKWKLMGATLVSSPAFEGAKIEPAWDVPALTAAAESDVAPSEHTGAMVALVPAAEDAARLAVEGGDPADELHVTLAYLGEAAEWTPEQQDAVRTSVAELVGGPVLGEVWGWAAFNPDVEGKDPCAVYLVGADGLGDLRSAVLGAALDAGGPVPEQHDPFVPHCTAGYQLPVTALTETGPVRFDRLRIAFAGQYEDIPLESVTAALTASAMTFAAADFEVPEPDELTALTITDDGRIYGHVAEWGKLSEVGRRVGLCLEPPTRPSPASTAPESLIGEAPLLASSAAPASTSASATDSPYPTSSAPAEPSSSPGADSGQRLAASRAKSSATGSSSTPAPASGGAPTPSIGGAPTLRPQPRAGLGKAGGKSTPPAGDTASVLSTRPSPSGSSKPSSKAKAIGVRSAESPSSSTPATSARPTPPISTTTTTPAASGAGSARHATEGSEHSETIPTSLTAQPRTSVIALRASSYPETPPPEWFANPSLDAPTPLVVTDEGRVFGHLASWRQCHTGYSGQCVTAPTSASAYRYFCVGTVRCSDGSDVAVGRITMGTGHASTARGLSAQATAAHYDNTGTCVADVACGEDEHGIWVSGALRPEVTSAQVRALRSSPLSGDWRAVNGALELVAALAVNVPGFPVPHPVAASGALVAAGVVEPYAPERRYAYFHQGEVRTDAGPLAVGKITLGTGHASMHASARAAAEHYDNTGTVVAVVRCRDGVHGPWLSGRILPGVSDDRIEELRRSGVSGDWRGIRRGATALELVGVLAVNVPGFPVPRTRALAAAGVRSLVAAGYVRRQPTKPSTRVLLSDLHRKRRVQHAASRIRAVRIGLAATRMQRATTTKER